MEYIGEHLWPGKLGFFFVILAVTSALLAFMAYTFGEIKNDNHPGWRKMGRTAFFVHAASVFSIVGLLLYMLYNHMFEYHYIWQHSNSEMPMRYIFSAFWEGQEGSTILWVFWQAVLGIILIFTLKKWEFPVMAIFSIAQLLLLTMITGIYIFDYKLGINPFTLLLREHPDFLTAPFIRNPNYLETLDGRGLNPLLQNYWMTIHPPTLFLGFAATLVPFAIAIAALWRNDFKEWVKPAIPWAFFAIMVLGVGILMGGAWAYESLSFGGFWAWDPVENASLVPWLTLVGGAHLLLIQRNKGGSLLSAFLLLILSYILIIYSTFLTKSGILGDSSVHAFTDLGLSGQLVFYVAFFSLLGFGILAYRYKQMPKKQTEDKTWSREFWMFVASLVLLLSAFQILFSTSIPVWNTIFGTNMAPPTDPIAHYNSYQVPFAIVIALLLGFTQFLNYRNTDFKTFASRTLLHVIIGLLFTIIFGLALSMSNSLYLLLLFASLFAVSANIHYLIRVVKYKVTGIGSATAHIGFGLILLGALVSNGAKEIISSNTSRYDLTVLDEQYKNNENILLMLEDTLKMGRYRVTYTGKERDGIHVYYNVVYMNQNNEELFTLKPFVQLNARMGNVREPSTKHYWDHDVFTYLQYAELEDRPKGDEQFKEPTEHNIKIGDTIFASNAILILERIHAVNDSNIKAEYGLSAADLMVKGSIRVYDFDTKMHEMNPIFAAVGTQVVTYPDTLNKLGLKIDLFKIDPQTETIGLKIQETKYKTKEFIILQAMIFPYINVLWLGCIIMAIGIIIAIVERNRKQKNIVA